MLYRSLLISLRNLLGLFTESSTSFCFNDTATTEIYTLSLHDALPIFRVREHDRVPWRAVPVAPGPVARRPLLHHSGGDGAVDVRAVQGRADRRAAEPADEDDVVLHAGFHDAAVAAVRVRPESVLRGEQHLQHPAAVFDCPTAAARTGAAHVGEKARGEGC